MLIKVMQLVNNIYRDEIPNGESVNPLGDYCAFGYFDALRFGEGQTIRVQPGNRAHVWDVINDTAVQSLDGRHKFRNLVGIIDDEEKYDEFERLAKEFPFLFLSLIRCRLEEETEISALVKSINQNERMICFLPYEHSEMMVLTLQNSYGGGIQDLLNIRDQLCDKLKNVFRTYTVFTVREDVLESEDILIGSGVTDQPVQVQLKMNIKDNKKAEAFVRELKKEFNGAKAEWTNILGDYDIVLWIPEICLCKLLPYYYTGKMLTHMYSQYNESLYNLETEIFFGRK